MKKLWTIRDVEASTIAKIKKLAKENREVKIARMLDILVENFESKK